MAAPSFFSADLDAILRQHEQRLAILGQDLHNHKKLLQGIINLIKSLERIVRSDELADDEQEQDDGVGGQLGLHDTARDVRAGRMVGDDDSSRYGGVGHHDARRATEAMRERPRGL